MSNRLQYGPQKEHVTEAEAVAEVIVGESCGEPARQGRAVAEEDKSNG